MTGIRQPLSSALIIAMSLVVATAGRADDWPQWRGPNRDGAESPHCPSPPTAERSPAPERTTRSGCGKWRRRNRALATADSTPQALLWCPPDFLRHHLAY